MSTTSFIGFRPTGREVTIRIAAALRVMMILWVSATASAQTFVSLKDPECIEGRSFAGWTVGDQYVDPDNGVPLGQYSISAELVLQANIGVALYHPTHTTGAGITGQVSLFAYIRDTAHPGLHSIAVGGAAYLSNWDTIYFNEGLLSYDYSDAMTRAAAGAYPGWFSSGQTGNGVWFASGPISSTSPNPYATTRYSEGNSNAPLPPTYDPNPPMPFWRVHFTQANLLAIVGGINAFPCSSPPSCPAKGYSTDPAAYVLDYAGMIAEAALESTDYDASPMSWIRNDASKDQVSMGVHSYAFGVYQYLP